MTKRYIATWSFFCICVGACGAQGTVTATQPTSESQIKHAAQQAHTAVQYQTVADFYGSLQKKFQKEADEEKQEWIRRSQNVMGPAAKYPRPVDSARNLYEYYQYKADELGSLSTRYGSLAEKARNNSVQ